VVPGDARVEAPPRFRIPMELGQHSLTASSAPHPFRNPLDRSNLPSVRTTNIMDPRCSLYVSFVVRSTIRSLGGIVRL